MKSVTLWGWAAVLVMGAALGCGDDSGGGTSTTGATTGPGGGTTSTGGTGGTGGTGNEGGGGTGGGDLCSDGQCVHECHPNTAEDLTAEAAITIEFTVGGNRYSPACALVSPGTEVTFVGVSGNSFVLHPLVGGVYDGANTVVDDTVITKTETGTEATFTMPDASAVVPYFCEIHAPGGMYGAIFVE